MIGSTITLTVNSVAKVLSRVDDSEPYTARYFLADSATRDYELKITHTVPAVRGASKESHLVRLDVTDYDVDGVVISKQSCWAVYETSIGRQDTTQQTYYADALSDWLQPTNIGLILNRES